MAQYKSYTHIERMETIETEGLLESGKLYIFPKLDGSNGTIFLNDDGSLGFGSRTRVLSLDNLPQSDNQRFMEKFVDDSKLKAFLTQYPHLILYVEYLIPHSIRDYIPSAWNKYYIFDVYNTVAEEYMSYPQYQPLLDAFDLEYIPPIMICVNPTIKDLYAIADKNNYLMKEDCIGEGIVIKNYDFKNQYNRLVYGKIVRAEFKATLLKKMGSPEREFTSPESKMCDKYLTQAFCEKEYQKVLERLDNKWSSRHIPMLLGCVYHEFVLEHIWDASKSFKDFTINFPSLQRHVYAGIKQHLPYLF